MALYINYPSWLDPYVFSFLPIRWYAVMYLVAFAIAYAIYSWQLKRDKTREIDDDTSQMLFICGIVGLLVGAHLFSIFFYSDESLYYLTHPWLIFWPFRNGQFIGLPGMSYHGGVVGALIGGWLYARYKKFNFLKYVDYIVAGIPLGYTFGRIGNFINAELYGRVTAKPWGMIFPNAGLFSTNEAWVREIADLHGIPYTIGDLVNLPRHPSQLYEAFFEGVVLFLILWFICRPLIQKKGLKPGSMLSFYIFGYGFFRFFIEYCRQPDANIGYVIALGEGKENIALFHSFLNISKGQIFCLLMIVCAVALFIFVNRRKEANVKKQHSGKKS